jgi:hypothetical protein
VASSKFSFGCYNTSGNPLTSASTSWVIYAKADGTIGTGPSITNLGLGMYETAPDVEYAGIIYCGTSAITPYVFVPSQGQQIVFPVFDSTGTPKDDLPVSGAGAVAWQSMFDAETGSPIDTSSFTFTNLTGGLYAADPSIPTGITGRLDLQSGQNPQFWEVNVSEDYPAPAFSNPEPTPPGPLGAAEQISFDLTYYGESPVSLTVFATFNGGQPELIVSLGEGGPVFTPLYSGSYVSFGSPGQVTMHIIRGAPWPSGPTISASVVDPDGQTAGAVWLWALVGVSTSSNVSTSTAQPTAIYGTDLRTYLDLGTGPDLDPYMLIVADPRVVMPEQLARRLTMPPGTLWYAPTVGYDLRALVNAALATGDLTQIQTAISTQCLGDERVKSVNVLLTRPNRDTLNVNILGIGAAGPFSIVFDVSALGVSNLSFTG